MFKQGGPPLIASLDGKQIYGKGVTENTQKVIKTISYPVVSVAINTPQKEDTSKQSKLNLNFTCYDYFWSVGILPEQTVQGAR